MAFRSKNNNDQHECVISVLKQRAALAEQGVCPAGYDGSLRFRKPAGVWRGIPVEEEEAVRAE